MSEDTSFMQWRQRAKDEIQEETPQVRWLLLIAAVVVVVGILAGVLMLVL